MPSSVDLSPEEVATLRALCDTIIPSIEEDSELASFYRRKASDLGVDGRIQEFVRDQFGVRQAAGFRQLLHIVESRARNLFLDGHPVRFSQLSSTQKTAYLGRWRDSRLGPKRTGFQALKRFTCFLYYSLPGPDGLNPNWKDIGYPGVLPEPATPHPESARIVPLVPDRDMELAADVCVIGAGAGGSVAAYEIQRAGFSVVVLEAGEYMTSDTVSANEYETSRRAFDSLATDDLSFQLFAGRGAGGGTFINWMTCLRPPLQVLREWEDQYGIVGLTGTEFQNDVETVWRTLEVNENESQRNQNNDALWQGCLALGYREGPDFQRIWRNAVGCRERCDSCGFGCPYSSKRSTVLNFLPEAFRAGTRFLFHTQAHGVELAGGQVQAVRADYMPEPGTSRKIRVKCRVVVLGGGAIHTPALLLRSGLGGTRVGRGLRLHPTTAVVGEFPHETRLWAGPPQTVAVVKFLDLEGSGHGFWIEAAPAHPGLFAVAVPWRDGRSHKDLMARRYRRSTATIVLLRERSMGRVSLDAHDEVRIDYRMTDEDRRGLTRGIQETGRILAAAGAKSLLTIHSTPIEVQAAHDRLTDGEIQRFFVGVAGRQLTPNRVLIFSAHLMGSCPMGADAQTAVVRPSGELWSTENIFVVDASVFPSSPGVNPMITIMAMARRTSRSVIARLKRSSVL